MTAPRAEPVRQQADTLAIGIKHMTSKKTAVRSPGRQGATAPDTTTPTTRKPGRSRPSPRELLDMVAPGQEVDPPADPARVAASLMLAAAMRAGRLWQADLTAPGVIVFVQPPTAEWVEPSRIAWARAVQEKAEPHDDGKRYRTDPDDGPLILNPSKRPEKWDREAGTDKFAAFVARQRGAVGISSNPEWLPPDLVAAADRRHPAHAVLLIYG